MAKESESAVFNDFNMVERQREEQALQRFKKAVEQLITLLRVSAGAHTAYLYWINRSRGQFVLEAAVTDLDDVVFEDRINIEKHFLMEWTDLTDNTMLYSGSQFEAEQLLHHGQQGVTSSIVVLPFINNGETVALTVAELDHEEDLNHDQLLALEAYEEAITNILKTYLELSDLLAEETQWIQFESVLNSFSERFTRYTLMQKLLAEVSAIVPTGGAIVVARGMDSWNAVLKNGDASSSVRLGMKMSENSQVNRALKSGEAQFSLHFNGNPKRLNASESRTEGASIAIPIDVHDRRQAVLLVWDDNPLIFRESVKHMITTLARFTGLLLSQPRYHIATDEDMLAGETGAYTLDLLESALECQIIRYNQKQKIPTSWLIFISPKDYQNLRTRFRLERLKAIQQEMVTDLNPNQKGLNGFVAFYSDSLFVVYIQAEEEHINSWVSYFKEQVVNKAASGLNYTADMNFYIGKHNLDFSKNSAYDIIQEAKQTFNTSVKEDNTTGKL